MASDDWKRLRKLYASRGLVLVLGAGVSKASCLPDWQALLETVAANEHEQGVIDAVKSGRISLPQAASVLEKRVGDRSEFVEKIRLALYKNLPDDVRSGDHAAVFEYLRSNTTLCAIASMCARQGKRHPYRRNDRIHALVTFNMDALLQKYIRAAYDRRLLRTMERASAGEKRRRINIYHMHGYLRFDDEAGDLTKEAPDAVVLTEGDYFDFFNNPNSMFNYTFLYLLRERHCLFVGLSMRDDNLRRLLHLSTQERLAGFRSEGRPDSAVEGKVRRHFAILLKDKDPGERRAIEDGLSRIGVRTLWVENPEAIDGQLGAVYEAGVERDREKKKDRSGWSYVRNPAAPSG